MLLKLCKLCAPVQLLRLPYYLHSKLQSITMDSFNQRLKSLIVKLHEINALKFGNFKMKVGINSPVYFDLRVIVSYPKVMGSLSRLLWEFSNSSLDPFDHICGVPYTALPIASIISVEADVPMLIRRKETKDYGTRKLIEGKFEEGDRCLIIEDVVTSGSSILETFRDLKTEGLSVTEAIVVVDREQGGVQNLASHGLKMRSLCTLTQIMNTLLEKGKVDQNTVDQVKNYISLTQIPLKDYVPVKEGGHLLAFLVTLFLKNSYIQIYFIWFLFSSVLTSSKSREYPSHPLILKPAYFCDFTFKTFIFAFFMDIELISKRNRLSMSFMDRAQETKSLVAAKLFRIMAEKRTNLCLSADTTNSMELLELASKVGPHICLLKIHIDIIKDFSKDFITNLVALTKEHNFLILEDRKFADIGHVVKLQYSQGVHEISSWADLVTVHPIPGPGIISGLKAALEELSHQDRGCFIVVEMSSQGNLNSADYKTAAVKLAMTHSDFVVGIVCQSSSLVPDPGLIQLTPGVKLDKGSDTLGQQYNSPEHVVLNGADVAVVGRGITEAQDIIGTAKEFQTRLWEAYEKRISPKE
ncbi:uncharacterized protein GBIM_13670 [Gryllus bimaculatus]|nr:uncharacterized protein GBIM_13670 [Gryllus bimaculatus]